MGVNTDLQMRVCIIDYFILFLNQIIIIMLCVLIERFLTPCSSGYQGVKR